MGSSSLSLVELGIQHMSESVFAGLCREVGTTMHVIMRREVVEFKQLYKRLTGEHNVMLSGSHREGFRMKGSDVDFMNWPNGFQVIWNLDQAQNYNTNGKVILCDCSESPPGFTLLEILIPTNHEKTLPFIVRMNDKFYVSSSIFRRVNCGPHAVEHGPCVNDYVGNKEVDYAYCFQCDFWPPSASLWIDRSQFWPQAQLVHDIVRNGCHIVAIGHKLGNHTENEWRISFSQAEQKLVYSMNHSQFLTYGLLKIFLKEIINNECDDQNKLLCSYHMKTAVFWAIQQNTISRWCPQNILECFWVCFKFLLKWVYEGVCPNFFIPENNMFLVDIHGQAQKILFCRLYELYEKGLACLLLCSSIKPYIIAVLHNPRQSICTDENNLLRQVELDIAFFSEICMCDIQLLSNLHSCINHLHVVEDLIGSPLTEYQVVSLQRITAHLFQTTAFLFLKRYTKSITNKLTYRADKMARHMLRLAASFGCISDMLYVAMYYYQTSRHTKALHFIEMTKIKLGQPPLTYNRVIFTCEERWGEVLAGQSLSTKLRQSRAEDIQLRTDICYMNELVPEQSALRNTSIHTFLSIPLYTLLYMLEMLSSINTDKIRAQRALNKLHDLVHFDKGVYIPKPFRNISWQILGICQQIAGDIHSSLYSYQQSLREEVYINLQYATLMRIQGLMRTIQNEYPCKESTDEEL